MSAFAARAARRESRITSRALHLLLLQHLLHFLQHLLLNCGIVLSAAARSAATRRWLNSTASVLQIAAKAWLLQLQIDAALTLRKRCTRTIDALHNEAVHYFTDRHDFRRRIIHLYQRNRAGWCL